MEIKNVVARNSRRQDARDWIEESYVEDVIEGVRRSRESVKWVENVIRALFSGRIVVVNRFEGTFNEILTRAFAAARTFTMNVRWYDDFRTGRNGAGYHEKLCYHRIPCLVLARNEGLSPRPFRTGEMGWCTRERLRCGISLGSG